MSYVLVYQIVSFDEFLRVFISFDEFLRVLASYAILAIVYKIIVSW